MVDGKILGAADPVTLLRIELTCLPRALFDQVEGAPSMPNGRLKGPKRGCVPSLLTDQALNPPCPTLRIGRGKPDEGERGCEVCTVRSATNFLNDPVVQFVARNQLVQHRRLRRGKSCPKLLRRAAGGAQRTTTTS